jgi:polyhydroxyalkanoate synthase subunit PhaC
MSEQKPVAPLVQTLADPAKMAVNLAKAFDGFASVARAFAARSEEVQKEGEVQAFPTQQMAQTLQTVYQAQLANPQRLMEQQQQLWAQYGLIWQNAWQRAIGQQVTPVVQPNPSDKRFKDKDWTENSAFDALKQAYLVTADWAREMVRNAEELDAHTKLKANFYVENLLNAFSPTNFPATNPEVLKATLASNAENLVRGLENLRKDMDTPDGRLRIKQVDGSSFKLGENIAVTPGKVVFRNALFELIQYSPQVPRTHEIPLLIVPPWINKYYILDLNEKKSFVKFCVENGLTVFIMSWVNADEKLGNRSFADYSKDGVLAAIDAVLAATGAPKVNTIGFCIGGSLVASTLGYMAAKDDERVNAATFLTTQVDFEKAGDLLAYVDDEQINWIEDRMRDKSYLPGARMQDAFNLLRSNDLIWSYVVNNYLLGKEPMAFDLLYWNSDSTRMPMGVHSFYLRECYLHNRLGKGELELDGTKIDLKKVKIPVYNLACRDDHIAPLPSVFKVGEHFGGETTLVVSGSGHIAGVVNPPAMNKYQYWTNEKGAATLEDWMNAAQQHPGSWWSHWIEWIAARSGDKVTAPVPGDRGLSVLCDAPGEYVRVSGIY